METVTPIPTIDFETHAIQSRPEYPPKPVSLGVRHPDGTKEFIAWGHPTGNTHTSPEQAKRVLAQYWDGPMLFQNAAFDIAVAAKHFDLPWPKNPLLIEDTMYLLYLFNPHARTLSLKPSAQHILGIPPDESDALEAWIKNNIPGINKKNPWGAHIAEAPANMVGPYCVGDVDRTWKLYEHLLPIITKDGMVTPYEREKKLMPILEAASTFGIRADADRLEHDLNKVYEPALVRVEKWLRDRLNAPGLDFGDTDSLAAALEKAGIVKEWIKTPTGKNSFAKDNIIAVMDDKEFLKYFLYRNALAYCLSNFLRKWARLAKNGGRIHPSWNSVRGDRNNTNGKQYGTITGRLSSSDPNFQNVSNEYTIEIPDGFPPMPLMRQYLLPEIGHEWLKRDFSSQEMRVLAHFEDGALMEAYKANPRLDPHQYAADLIRQHTGLVLTRADTKRIAFSLLYGSGVKHLAETLGVAYHVAFNVKEAYLNSFPDVKDLNTSIKNRGRSGRPVRTWGGRLIFAEKHEGRDLSYKLLNHLIQGSSADITKESVIQFNDVKKASIFLMTVHDENCTSAPTECVEQEMSYLREAMDNLPLDAPLASEGFRGPNYAELREMA